MKSSLHRRPSASAGFTLVELMVVSTLFVLVSAALFTTFLGGSRMLRRCYAEAELSLRTRELRDKLLFRAEPTDPANRVVWGGLLSSTNAVHFGTTGANVHLSGFVASAGGTGISGSRDKTVPLGFSNAGSRNCSLHDANSVDVLQHWPTKWLDPGRLDFFAGSPAVARIVEHPSEHQGRLFYIHVTARKNVGGITVAEHNERIVVPAFGQMQTTRSDGGGGL